MNREDEKRRILTLVAEGTMAPTEAADRLAGLEDDATVGQPGTGAPRPEVTDGRIQRVRVVASARSVEIVADPDVLHADAIGSHTARHEGDTLVIESMHDGDDENGSGFRFGRHGNGRIVIGVGERHLPPLVVRMHPDLALEAELQAGSMKIRRVHGPIRASVAAGSLQIDEFRDTLDLEVAAGSVRARGRLDHGASQIRCEAGKVHLDLDAASSVRIRARSDLGKVSLPDDDVVAVARGRKGWGLGDERDVVVGSGAGSLDVEASLGKIQIRVESP